MDKRKNAVLFGLLLAALGVLFLLSCLLGAGDTGPAESLAALWRGERASAAYRIIVYLRLPRVLGAILAGSALAVSGVLIQAVLHNPMAAPNIIGVNAGAGLAAAVTLALFPTAISALPGTAFLGALCSCLLIWTIAAKSGAGRLTITLVGIAVSSVLNALINSVKVLFPDTVYDADVFMIGGFSGLSYARLCPACFFILGGLLLAFALAKDTDVLSLGDVSAASLGMHTRSFRFVLLLIASALAGAAVSFAGLLGFVGLLVPHILRRFVGSRHGLLLPASALLGADLVLGCDLLARTAFAPYELPVGIVLSLLGGSFFLVLVLGEKRRMEL